LKWKFADRLRPLEPPALADANGLVRLEAGNSLGPAARPIYFNIRFGRAPKAEVKTKKPETSDKPVAKKASKKKGKSEE